MNAPCKECEYREVACHVKCPAYRMYKRKRETMQDNAIKQNDVLAYLGNTNKEVNSQSEIKPIMKTTNSSMISHS
nr:MAG TPA: hypothetical protein [Caudoviricetes sp.]